MSKRKADPIHYDSLTDIQQRQIIDSLNIDIELDFIVKSTSGDTKIKFSETSIYYAPSLTTEVGVDTIDGTNLFFAACSYEDVLEVIEDVLMSRYVSINPKFRSIPFKVAPLPIGTSIFGKTPQVKARVAAKPFGINNEATWKEYKSTNVILENYEKKRKKISTKHHQYIIPTSCKVRLAVVIEPEEIRPRNTSMSPTLKSSTSKAPSQINKKKKPFVFPKNMAIDIIGPCTKTEDQNHTVKYSSGSIDVLSSFSYDLSVYSSALQGDGDLTDSDDSVSEEDELMGLHLSEFRADVARYCLENVPVYAFDKKVIGSKSILLGSIRKTLSMKPLMSTADLRAFILEKVKKMKENKKGMELCVRLSFGVATSSDKIVDIADFEATDDEDDNRFSQMEMNEPRLKLSRQEMSKENKLGYHAIKEFLKNEYKQDGPMHHGFTEEHSSILFTKLCSAKEKIQEYNKKREASTIFDLLDAQDVKKSCYGLKPGKGDYPPIGDSTDPPESKEWAKANKKSLEKGEREKFKTTQYKVMNRQLEVTEKLLATYRDGNEVQGNQVTTATRDIIINLGRMRQGAIKYTSVPIGEGQAVKVEMKLSCLQERKAKWFKKKDAENSEIKMIVSLDANDGKYYISESDFGSVSIEDVVKKCSINPIQILITEEQADDDWD